MIGVGQSLPLFLGIRIIGERKLEDIFCALFNIFDSKRRYVAERVSVNVFYGIVSVCCVVPVIACGILAWSIEWSHRENVVEKQEEKKVKSE